MGKLDGISVIERNDINLHDRALTALEKFPLEQAESGQTILKRGDEPGVVVLVSGLVRCISTTMVNRTPKVVDVGGKGAWLGLESWSGHQKHRYESMTNTTFKRIDWEDFLSEDNDIIRIQSLVNQTQAYLRNRTFTQMSGGKLTDRIIYLLYSLRQICDEQEIEFTLKDVAQLLGTNMTRAGAALKELEKEEAVECSYRKYYIPPRDKILEVATRMKIYNPVA